MAVRGTSHSMAYHMIEATTAGAPTSAHAARQQAYMLCLFVWVATLQALSWTPLAAVGAEVAEKFFPGVTANEILQQLNWGPIVQMVVTPVALAIITNKNGLSRSLRAACVLATASCLLRLVPSILFRSSDAARLMLQLAGMACGASAPFIQGAPSHFSKLWFPPEQRSRATAAAFLGTPLGLSFGYALPALLVGDDGNMLPLFLVETLLCVPGLLAVALYCPDRPRDVWWLHPTSAAPPPRANKAWRRELVDEVAEQLRLLRTLLRSPSFVLVACACAIANGPYQAWVGALPTLLHSGDLSWRTLDAFSLGSSVTYALGAVIGGDIADRHFQRRLRSLLVLLYGSSLAIFVALTLALPSPWWPAADRAPPPPPALPSGVHTPPSAPSAPAAPPPPAAPFSLPLAVLAALAGFSGLLVGGTSPASLELAAQISYPVPEGLSANLITNVLTQSFTIVFLAVLQGPLPDTASTAAICLGFGLCLLALLPVRERYHRLDAERSRLLDVAQGSSTPPPAAATAADPSSYLSPTHLPCQPVAAPSQ